MLHIFPKLTLALVFIVIASSATYASPSSGFHKGPYFLLEGGILNFEADKVGRNYEPTVGFHFGWNLKNYIAPELQIRYATNKNNGNREHIINVNVNTVFTFITNQLTEKNSVQLLPFIQGGVIAQFAAIPGDPLSADRTVPMWGPGIGLGGGIKMLIKRYGYIGVLAQCDFVFIPEKKQDIGGAETVILNGGWEPEPGFTGMAGVHF